MPTMMCFGDSNTHGTPPMDDTATYRRFDTASRWPVLAARALGWELVEEGLPGRTAQFDDVVMGPQVNGQIGLKIALQSHGPIDVLVLMLGTNDVKAQFGATPETITGGVAGLVAFAMGEEMQTRHGGFRILLICPPPVLEQGPIALQFYGAAAKSRVLPPLYAALAARWGLGFLDAGRVIGVSAQDGVHFGADAHASLATAVAGSVRGLVA